MRLLPPDYEGVEHYATVMPKIDKKGTSGGPHIWEIVKLVVSNAVYVVFAGVVIGVGLFLTWLLGLFK